MEKREPVYLYYLDEETDKRKLFTIVVSANEKAIKEALTNDLRGFPANQRTYKLNPAANVKNFEGIFKPETTDLRTEFQPFNASDHETAQLINSAYKNGQRIAIEDEGKIVDSYLLTQDKERSSNASIIHISPLLHGTFLLADKKYDLLNQYYSLEEIEKIFNMFNFESGLTFDRGRLGNRGYIIANIMNQTKPFMQLAKQRIDK